MERISIQPRADWQAKNEQIGFDWHTQNGQTYWDETAYWKFTQADIAQIQSTVSDGYAMLVEAIDYVIKNKLLAYFGYTPEVSAMIESSWNDRDDETPIFGKFGLALGGASPKIMSFSSDVPTNLFETSMAQRAWVQEVLPNAGQLNNIHEALIARFRAIALFERTKTREIGQGVPPLHIAVMPPAPEAETAASYLQTVAAEAGVVAKYITLDQVGWQDPYDDVEGYYVDPDGDAITKLLLMYPLAYLINDDFGAALVDLVTTGEVQIIEPAWKLLASNKRLLATMWERNAYHPALLNTVPATSGTAAGLLLGTNGYVSKPYSGFDGQNIQVFNADATKADETAGSFAADDRVLQQRASLTETGGVFMAVDAWVIDNGNVVALGVREADTPILDSAARFVPHIVE